MHEKRFKDDIARLRSPNRLERLEVQRVVDLCMEEVDLSSVLDVGTGSGVFAEAFAGRGLQVSGVDANPDMLEAARFYTPSGDFREGVAEALPYSDNLFDLVFLGLVLHETDDPLKALAEAHRISKRRVCVLEWPYREEEFGPPLSDRLDPETVADLAHKAGLGKIEAILLSKLVLYRFTF